MAIELWECETKEEIASWLLENSEYYFELALEEAEKIIEERGKNGNSRV